LKRRQFSHSEAQAPWTSCSVHSDTLDRNVYRQPEACRAAPFHGDWQRVQSRQMLWTTNHRIRCWVSCVGLAALHKTELETVHENFRFDCIVREHRAQSFSVAQSLSVAKRRTFPPGLHGGQGVIVPPQALTETPEWSTFWRGQTVASQSRHGNFCEARFRNVTVSGLV
jgi:hypothetical protein